MELERLFLAGGPVMYLIALLGGLGIPVTLAGLFFGIISKRPRRTLIASCAVLGLGALVLVLGAAGSAWGLHRTEQAAATFNPDDAEIIRHAGSSEARAPLVAALALGLFPAVAGLGLLGLGLIREPRFGGPS
jgi:hypothetical protein